MGTCKPNTIDPFTNTSSSALQEAFDDELGQKMRMNTRRYHTLLSDAVEKCLPEPNGDEVPERDVLDVLLDQRTGPRDDDAVMGER